MKITEIRDIAVTIAAVLLIISMVHYDKYGEGLYLGLPISNDKNAIHRIGSGEGRDGFYVKAYTSGSMDVDIENIRDYIDVRHKNSCVNGYTFRD